MTAISRREVLGALAGVPLVAAGLSPAAVSRAVEAARSTTGLSVISSDPSGWRRVRIPSPPDAGFRGVASGHGHSMGLFGRTGQAGIGRPPHQLASRPLSLLEGEGTT